MVIRPIDAEIVLVVDDRAAERELRVAAFKRGGFLAVGAATGEQALGMAASLRVHAVVVDRGSPTISAEDVCRHLKSEPRFAGTAVVVVSPLPNDGAAPCDLYLHGSISPDMLVQRVSRLLGSRGVTATPHEGRITTCPLCHHALETSDGVMSVRSGVAHVLCWLAQPREDAAPPPAQRVAVVDDNEMGRYVVSRALRAAGLNVTEAATGGAALELLDPTTPRLYLLDVMLPDMDGFDVCRSIKQAHPQTIVLPVTAVYRSAGHRDLAIELGAAGFLTRPIPTDVIVRTVSALVSAS